MIRRPPRSTRTDTLVPYTTLFRAARVAVAGEIGSEKGGDARLGHVDAGQPRAQRDDVGVIMLARELRRQRFGHERAAARRVAVRSEEHTSELQSLMRISYAVFCLKKKNKHQQETQTTREHRR